MLKNNLTDNTVLLQARFIVGEEYSALGSFLVASQRSGFYGLLIITVIY